MNTPSRQELIADIRRAAIACNPSILDLVFGCQISRKGSEDSLRHYRVIEDVGFGVNPKKVWINSIPFGAMPLELEKDLIENGGEFKIIGRELTLADILEVMREASERIEGQLFVDDMGYFSIAKVGRSLDRVARWNLRLSLEQQADETIIFIHELVK